MTSQGRIALGIDVSAHQVSAALVERTGQGFRVLASASSDLAAGETERSVTGQVRTLSRTVRRLGHRARSAHVKAALSLSASPMLVQILDMPRHLPANIREFVGNELKQYVALSGKSTQFDFCGIGASADGQKRMLAVAVETEQAEAAADACIRAGVTLDVIEPSLLAYARAFHVVHKRETSGRSVLIAVLGGGSLAISLFCRGTLDFVRVRDVPADMQTGESLGRWLCDELKAVARYQSANAADAGGLYARVVVQGSGPSAAELDASLRGMTGIDSLVVTDSREPFAGSTGEAASGDAVSLMAVGAAMKVLDPSADDLKINLLPDGVRLARSLTRHALLTAIAAACTFLGVLVAIFLLSRTAGVAHEHVEQAKLDQELYTTRALISQDKYIDQELSRVQQRLKPIQALLQGQRDIDWSAVLNAVRRSAPKGVCVTEMLDNDDGRLSLKGLALSCEAAQSFARGLDGNKTFLGASMTRVAQEQGRRGLMEYQIECRLRPTEVTP